MKIPLEAHLGLEYLRSKKSKESFMNKNGYKYKVGEELYSVREDDLIPNNFIRY